ncbi:sigma-70 family RNA polymerase sigma factor [Streptomyces sp. NBC_00887]|nr:sigma-70 family RNA polymerase sigma factor [Streptomyces sp. NBC_00887]
MGAHLESPGRTAGDRAQSLVGAEEAEDAVQEAMIRAVEDPDVPYGRVRPWLRLATLRACADRHRQVARDRELSKSPYAAAPVEPFLVEDAACDRAEARWLADRSAELLPARQVQALRLRAQDLDVGQVARTMGLSYHATESLLARARRSLRNALAGCIALATALWMCARRFPRTGIAQSAGATSAAVTLAVADAVLPAGPLDRPDSRPPSGSGPETVVAPAAELPAPRVRSRPHGASPSSDPHRMDRAPQGASWSVPGPPRTHELPDTVTVEVSIESGAPVPVVPPVATPTTMPSLPVDAPDVLGPEGPSVPSGAATARLGGTFDLR